MNRILTLLVFIGLSSYGQNPNAPLINTRSMGMHFEYGAPYTLPEGFMYSPVLSGVCYYTPIYQTSNFFNIGFDFLPHAGGSFINEKYDYELGLNVRICFNFAVSKKDVVGLKFGSGPHFITVNTERQVKGFIFSDNYQFSYRRAFNIAKVPFLLDLCFGLRHISNAGIKKPNEGINNVIYGIGIRKCF